MDTQLPQQSSLPPPPVTASLPLLRRNPWLFALSNIIIVGGAHLVLRLYRRFFIVYALLFLSLFFFMQASFVVLLAVIIDTFVQVRRFNSGRRMIIEKNSLFSTLGIGTIVAFIVVYILISSGVVSQFQLLAKKSWIIPEYTHGVLTQEESMQQMLKQALRVENLDTDGDGLLDREEVTTYKTDPRNPDTDGDGFKDGDEVKQGYNPNGSGKLIAIEETEDGWMEYTNDTFGFEVRFPSDWVLKDLLPSNPHLQEENYVGFYTLGPQSIREDSFWNIGITSTLLDQEVDRQEKMITDNTNHELVSVVDVQMFERRGRKISQRNKTTGEIYSTYYIENEGRTYSVPADTTSTDALYQTSRRITDTFTFTR